MHRCPEWASALQALLVCPNSPTACAAAPSWHIRCMWCCLEPALSLHALLLCTQIVGGSRYPSSIPSLRNSGCPSAVQVCADTFIGNDQLRGVSGGQRKRVTTGGASFLSDHHYCTTSDCIASSDSCTAEHCLISRACPGRVCCVSLTPHTGQQLYDSCFVLHVLWPFCWLCAACLLCLAVSLLIVCMAHASSSNNSAMCAGEMIVGPKKTLFLDEISTGLDSSTTFQITRTLREFSHIRKATVLVALLQPTPETYNLFDDIMLLSEGTVLVLYA